MTSSAAQALTDRDRALLDTLTQRVRTLSVAQVGRAYWRRTANPTENAARRLGELQAAGLVELFTLLAHPEIPLVDPVLTWRPGLAAGDFAEASRKLGTRWRQPEQTTAFVIASESAANELGGHGGRRPRPSEGTHDMHLAAVYLLMVKELPTRARTWRSEASIYAGRTNRAQKLPDAMVRDGRCQTAIEFGGAYDRQKLEAFHQYCQKNRLGYEVW